MDFPNLVFLQFMDAIFIFFLMGQASAVCSFHVIRIYELCSVLVYLQIFSSFICISNYSTAFKRSFGK